MQIQNVGVSEALGIVSTLFQHNCATNKFVAMRVNLRQLRKCPNYVLILLHIIYYVAIA